MKKEVKILRQKAINSLVLSIELFNRPSEMGRAHGVLIFLDHAFEMLFKAIILHRGGRIRDRTSVVLPSVFSGRLWVRLDWTFPG